MFHTFICLKMDRLDCLVITLPYLHMLCHFNFNYSVYLRVNHLRYYATKYQYLSLHIFIYLNRIDQLLNRSRFCFHKSSSFMCGFGRRISATTCSYAVSLSTDWVVIGSKTYTLITPESVPIWSLFSNNLFIFGQ